MDPAPGNFNRVLSWLRPSICLSVAPFLSALSPLHPSWQSCLSYSREIVPPWGNQVSSGTCGSGAHQDSFLVPSFLLYKHSTFPSHPPISLPPGLWDPGFSPAQGLLDTAKFISSFVSLNAPAPPKTSPSSGGWQPDAPRKQSLEAGKGCGDHPSEKDGSQP